MLSVTFLGTGAACPTVDRNVAGLAVQREGETLLFDCGEGTQRQMMRYGVGFSFTEIFFTHYHADHMLGVTGLLRTMGLQDRTAPVTLYGPAGRAAHPGRGPHPRHRAEQVSGRDRRDQAGRPARARRLRPRGFRDRAPGRHRGLRAGRAHPAGPLQPGAGARAGRARGAALGAAAQGRDGDARRRPRWARRTWSAQPRPGRTLVYSGDTRPTCAVLEAARGADLLIHEATFGGDEPERAVETGHSTAREAATRRARRGRAAAGADPHQLRATTADAPELLAEARAVFPETVIARDGMTVEVPFAE